MSRPRVSLARLPTPLQRLDRLSAHLGAEVWVKRDDLTGLGLSGNKVRKLEYLLADAKAQGHERVVTCGGLQSNHCRATAIAARQMGLEPVLLLRGAPPAVPDSNLLLDHLLGAEVHYCDADTYRNHRDERMAELVEGRGGYVIPEGGSNGLGSLGYVAAAEEVADQAYDAIRDLFDRVVVAVGSGGTLAGLAMGPTPGMVSGVAVCDDAEYFEARVEEIAREGLAGPLPINSWEVVEGYQGPAYAVAEKPVWDTIRLVARLEGLLLDPVYTGKAMHALVSEVRAGRWGGRLLFWHTGGAFGLFGRGDEVVG